MAKKRNRKSKNQKEKFHDYVMSDQSRVNRNGYRVLVKGIEISDFTIALNSHNNNEQSIGRWENIRVEGDKLLGRLYYNMNNAKAVDIYNDVEGGFRNAVSMGMIPLEWSDAPEHLLSGQKMSTLIRCELYECSAVNIPADAGAIRLYKNDKGQVLELSAVPILNSNPKKVMNPELIKLLALHGLSASTDAEAFILLAKAKTDADAKITAQQNTLTSQSSQMEDLALKANADVLKTDSQKNFFKSMYAQDAVMALEYVKTLEVGDVGDTTNATQSNANTQSISTAQGLPDLAIVLAALQGGGNVNPNDERKDWTYLEWFKNDTKGLEKMEANEPDKFLELKGTLKTS